MKNQLLHKIEKRSARVAITSTGSGRRRLSASVGLGYVGLPLAVAFAEAGFPVVGIDADGRKVAALKRGESYVQDRIREQESGGRGVST